MANDIILSVRDLKKYFSTKNGELHAVDGVSFDIPRGTTLGVVGESGCGKSTLGRVILHLLQRTSGTICFDGEDISDVSPKRLHELRREMQIIFQDPFSSIDPRKTVSEIIGEPLLVHKLVDNSADYEKRVREIMDTVGLARRLKTPIRTSWTEAADSVLALAVHSCSSLSLLCAMSLFLHWTCLFRPRS